MKTQATAKASPAKTKQSVPEKTKTGAILFELENLLIHGRQIEFQAIKSVLSDKGIKLSTMEYVRACMDKPSRDFLTTLLADAGKSRLSKEKIEEELEEAAHKAIGSGKHSPPAPLIHLINEAGKRGHVIGALSNWDKETAAGLLSRLGLDIPRSNIYSCREHWNQPAVDGWLRLAKAVGVPPGRCMCLVTGLRSYRAALSARMPCIVMPDEYTSYQDFSGADMLIEGFTQHHGDEVLSLLETR